MVKRWTDGTKPNALLQSAIDILSTSLDSSFVVKPWRTIMQDLPSLTPVKMGRRATDPLAIVAITPPPGETAMTKATAKTTSKAMKEAEKKIAPVPKHVPGESSAGVKGIWPTKAGVDKTQADVVQSGVDSDTTGEKTMTDTKTLPPAQLAKEAAVKQAMADKAAKIAAATKAKEDKAAAAATDKAASAQQKAVDAAKAKADREAKQAEKAAAKLAALPEGSKRTYLGSMTALADRVKEGKYVKGMTGQLRSSDDLAIALDAVPTDNVIQLALKALHLTENPYTALNRGQQSMNLRNKLRGAIRAEEGMGLIVVPGDEKNPPVRCTLAYVKEIRDANNYATAEDAAAKKAEAKAKKEAEASAKKAADAKAKQEAADKAKAAKTPAQAAA